MQGTGSISQTLSLNAGSYTLSFQAARRDCCVAPYVQPVQVSVDGVPVGGLVSPASTNFSSVSIPFSVATSGAHTIAFTGTDPSDKTTFIDLVTLASSNVVATTTTGEFAQSVDGRNQRDVHGDGHGQCAERQVAFTADGTRSAAVARSASAGGGEYADGDVQHQQPTRARTASSRPIGRCR